MSYLLKKQWKEVEDVMVEVVEEEAEALVAEAVDSLEAVTHLFGLTEYTVQFIKTLVPPFCWTRSWTIGGGGRGTPRGRGRGDRNGGRGNPKFNMSSSGKKTNFGDD